jgi:hypothetical protein
MKRSAPTPFDPDALMQAQGLPDLSEPTAPGTLMLSDLIAETPKATEAGQTGPGTSTPLDNVRKARLARLARSIWQRLHHLGLIQEGETAFRHRIALRACGRRISGAVVSDFKMIQAELLKEADQHQAAAKARRQAMTTGLDIARHKLVTLCKERGFPESYADGVARRIYKRPVCALNTAKEVWSVFYTITNNANARDGKGRASNRFKSLKAKRAHE